MRDECAFDACRKPAEEASSLPPEVYLSDAFQSAEIERFFRGGWVGVGRSDMVAGPGDFITLDFAGQTVLLLRDAEGVLRAYANTCRHRGARLAEGSGTCKGIRCPFHSWFYALDGRLVSAPQMEAATGFERGENGLIAYRAEERGGFVFVCLDQAAGPLDDHLGDFLDIHAPWPLAELTTVRRRELEVDCNWKLFLDVFNEYYHLPFVHPTSIDSIYAGPDPADQVTGAFATQFGRTEGTGALLESDQDHALPGFDTRVAAYLDRLDAALDEDVPALINQQRGMACPDAVPGRFQPELEPNVARFARWYSNAIRGLGAGPINPAPLARERQ